MYGFTDMGFYAVIVQIIKVLGEGGFSFVYLAQDEHSGVRSNNTLVRMSILKLGVPVVQRQFALKKIRCPTGAQGVKEAMREVEAYRRFKWVFQWLSHKLYSRY